MKKSYFIQIKHNNETITCAQPASRAEYDRIMAMVLEMANVLSAGTVLAGYERKGNDFERIHQFILIDDSDNPDNESCVAWGV